MSGRNPEATGRTGNGEKAGGCSGDFEAITLVRENCQDARRGQG